MKTREELTKLYDRYIGLYRESQSVGILARELKKWLELEALLTTVTFANEEAKKEFIKETTGLDVDRWLGEAQIILGQNKEPAHVINLARTALYLYHQGVKQVGDLNHEIETLKTNHVIEMDRFKIPYENMKQENEHRLEQVKQYMKEIEGLKETLKKSEEENGKLDAKVKELTENINLTTKTLNEVNDKYHKLKNDKLKQFYSEGEIHMPVAMPVPTLPQRVETIFHALEGCSIEDTERILDSAMALLRVGEYHWLIMPPGTAYKSPETESSTDTPTPSEAPNVPPDTSKPKLPDGVTEDLRKALRLFEIQLGEEEGNMYWGFAQKTVDGKIYGAYLFKGEDFEFYNDQWVKEVKDA